MCQAKEEEILPCFSWNRPCGRRQSTSRCRSSSARSPCSGNSAWRQLSGTRRTWSARWPHLHLEQEHPTVEVIQDGARVSGCNRIFRVIFLKVRCDEISIGIFHRKRLFFDGTNWVKTILFFYNNWHFHKINKLHCCSADYCCRPQKSHLEILGKRMIQTSRAHFYPTNAQHLMPNWEKREQQSIVLEHQLILLSAGKENICSSAKGLTLDAFAKLFLELGL